MNAHESCPWEDDRHYTARRHGSPAFYGRGEELGACPACGGALREHNYRQTEPTAGGDFARVTRTRWVCEHWRGPDPRESGKVYEGTRSPAGGIVTVDGVLLDPRLDLVEHSPTGFAWGYGGSGPSQLALAILADILEDDAEAQALYHDFKRRVIAGIEADSWTLTAVEIMTAVDAIRNERG